MKTHHLNEKLGTTERKNELYSSVSGTTVFFKLEETCTTL